MRLLKNTGFGPSTLLFTSLAVVFALILLVLLGHEQRGAQVAAMAVLTLAAALLAYWTRRRSGAEGGGYWALWLDTGASGDRQRRSMVPYVLLFAVLYAGLVALAVFATASLGLNIPQPLYLLFIWGADQVALLFCARRVRRPLLREELVALYSGTGLVIVLLELPTIMAITRYGAWDGSTLLVFAAIAAAVFTVHYFGLTRLPRSLLRQLAL